MKDKSWIIIVIMAVALVISIGYSIYISNRNAQLEKTAATTSIIEMTATTVTIKNTLTGTGIIGYVEIENEEESVDEEETSENSDSEENLSEINSSEEDSSEMNSIDEGNNEEINSEETVEKEYQISISIEDKDLEKAEVGEDVEISIVDDETNLTYSGKVTEVNELSSNKSTINVEITNADDKIEDGMTATCTVIVEKAENVVALPIEAIQVNEEGETYVNVVQEDETTKQVIIETGISDNYYVEITSGLVAGDRVQIVKTATSPDDAKNQNETNNSIANVINSST